MYREEGGEKALAGLIEYWILLGWQRVCPGDEGLVEVLHAGT